MNIEALVAQLIDAGTPPALAAAIVARAYVEGVNAVERPAPGLSARQERNRRYYEKKASEKRLNATEQDAQDVSETPPLKSPPITPKKLPPHSSLRSDTSARAKQIFGEQFWPIYPRKTERKAAEAKFIAVVLAGADPEMLVAGARRYADSKPEPKFTKHPTTWLSKGCWEDEQLPRDGPSKPKHSILTQMISGEYWDNLDDQQPSDEEPRRDTADRTDQGATGFAGPVQKCGGVERSGTVLDLRPTHAGWGSPRSPRSATG